MRASRASLTFPQKMLIYLGKFKVQRINRCTQTKKTKPKIRPLRGLRSMKTKLSIIIALLFAPFFPASAGEEVKKQESAPKVRTETVEKKRFQWPFRPFVRTETHTRVIPVASPVHVAPPATNVATSQAPKPQTVSCPSAPKKTSDPLVTMKASTRAWYIQQCEDKKKLECDISNLKAQLAQSGTDKKLVADLEKKLAQASSAGESLVAENKNLHSRITELEQELCEVNARLTKALATSTVLSEVTVDESSKFDTIQALLAELAGVGKDHEEKIARIDSRTASLEVCAVTRDDRISVIEDFLAKAFSNEVPEVEAVSETISQAPAVSVDANQSVSVTVNPTEPAQPAQPDPVTTIRRTTIRRLSAEEVAGSAVDTSSEGVFVDWGIERL